MSETLTELRSESVKEMPPRSTNDAVTPRVFPLHVLLTLAARVLMAANSVAVGIIIARRLGGAALGAYSTLTVAAQLAVHFASGGLPAANIYFVAQERRRIIAATANSFFYALACGSAVAFAITAADSLAPKIFKGIPLALVALACASIPFQLINLFGVNLFLVMKRVRAFNLLDLGSQSVGLFGAVIALVALRSDLRTLLSVNASIYFAVALAAAFFIRRAALRFYNEETRGDAETRAATWRADMTLFRSMLRYSFKLHLMWMATMLTLRSDLLIVNAFRGAAEAGVYAVATQGSLALALLPAVVSHLLLPRIASQNGQETKDESGALAAAATRNTALALFFGCLIAAPASFLLPFVYGAGFQDASRQFLLLLPGIFLVGLQTVLVQYFVGRGAPARPSVYWIVTFLFNVALNFAFVPRFGARAAAIDSTLAYALVFALVARDFRRTTHRSFSETYLPRPSELREAANAFIAQLRGAKTQLKSA